MMLLPVMNVTRQVPRLSLLLTSPNLVADAAFCHAANWHGLASQAFNSGTRHCSSTGASPTQAASTGGVNVLVAETSQGCFASVSVALASSRTRPLIRAAQNTLTALLDALGSRTPSFVMVSCSAPHEQTALPLNAIRSHLSRLSKNETKGATSIPVFGCSSDMWALKATVADSVPSYHLTISVAHLPRHEVHSFYTPSDALPSIPHLREALSSRKPQFMFCGTSEEHVAGLSQRLQNMFGQGCVIGAAAAAMKVPPPAVGMWVPHGMPGMHLLTLPLTPQPLATQISDQQTEPATAQPRAGAGGSTRRGKAGDADSQAAPPQLHPSKPVVHLPDATIQTAGCTGIILYPAPTQTLDKLPQNPPQPSVLPHFPTHQQPAWWLSPEEAVCVTRVMLGQDRFSSVQLPANGQHLLQPPPTTLTPLPQGGDPWMVDWMQPQTCLSSTPRQSWKSIHMGSYPAPMQLRRVQPVKRSTPARQGKHQAEEGRQQEAGQEQELAGKGVAGGTGRKAGATDESGRASAAGASAAGEQGTSEAQSSQPALLHGQRLNGVPLFNMGKLVALLPGTRATFRIFEKRYQLLLQQAVSQGGCWGFCFTDNKPVPHVRGILACVHKYFLSGDHIYVTVQGGERFILDPSKTQVQPGSFGLLVGDVQIVQDEELRPGCAEASTKQAVQFAQEAVQLLEDALLKDAQSDSQPEFGSSLLAMGFSAASSSDTVEPSVPSAAVAAAAGAPKSNPTQTPAKTAKHPDLTALDRGPLFRTPWQLSVEPAVDLSMQLAALLPPPDDAHLGSLQSVSARNRLDLAVSRLRRYPNLCQATARQLLELDVEHPLRQLMPSLASVTSSSS